MRAGRLRHRITVEQKSVARGTFGEETITWTHKATAWASVEPLRGQEYLEARQQQADVTHRVRMRYQAGIEPTMRVKHELDSRSDRYLEIVSVIEPFIRGEQLQLMCREEVDL